MSMICHLCIYFQDNCNYYSKKLL